MPPHNSPPAKRHADSSQMTQAAQKRVSFINIGPSCSSTQPLTAMSLTAIQTVNVTYDSGSPLSHNLRSASTPRANLISDELPAGQRLARVKEFKITQSNEGKYLACGELVHVYPKATEFKIRILNLDFNNGGKLKDFVEFDKSCYDKMVSCHTEIQNICNSGKLNARRKMLEENGLTVWLQPDSKIGGRLEFKTHDGGYSQMIISTFNNMMSLKEPIFREFYNFETRLLKNRCIYQEILNRMAYDENEDRINNDDIPQPNQTNFAAISKTIKNLQKQISKIIDKTENLAIA